MIIGSGIVGLNAAITCLEKQPGLRVLVVDRGAFPIGASTRNAGFACFGSISEVISDIDEMGRQAALDLFVKRKRGLDRLTSLVGEDVIDLQWHGGFEVFSEDQAELYERCIAAAADLNHELARPFGGDVFVPADEQLPGHGLKGFSHMIAHPYEGQLHPGKLVIALQEKARGLGATIIGGVAVTEINETTYGLVEVISDDHIFQCRYAVVATNGFTRKLMPTLDLQPARNQVLVTTQIPGLKLKGTFHYNSGYVYFRNIDGRVLIGGARHIAMEEESTETFGMTDNISEWLEVFLRRHLVQEVPGIELKWSGIMGVGPVKEPIVQMHSEHIAVAVRLGGMGVAIGSLVGHDVAEMVMSRL